MIKAVIFDMDGVLVDSEPVYLKVNQQMFSDFGIVFTEQENNKFIGVSSLEMWAFLKRRYNLRQSVEELVKIQGMIFLQYLKMGDVKPIPGTTELLKDIKQKNLRIGLASSSQRNIVDKVVEIFKIRQYFDAIVTIDDVKISKPAPDIFLMTAENLAAKPSECIVIEDSKNGVTAAKQAGMRCIGLRHKGSEQDISQADIMVDALENLQLNNLL